MNIFKDLLKVMDEGPNIDFLIKDEVEAIDGYTKEMSKTDNPQLIALFKHIIAEEQEHIEELQNAKKGIYEALDSKICDGFIIASTSSSGEALKESNYKGNYFTKNPKEYKIFNNEQEAINLAKKIPSAVVKPYKLNTVDAGAKETFQKTKILAKQILGFYSGKPIARKVDYTTISYCCEELIRKMDYYLEKVDKGYYD